MFQNIIDITGLIIREVMDGSILNQIVEGLSNTGPNRQEILFAFVLIGFSIGAGIWIGVEIAKSFVKITKSVFLLFKRQ